MRGWWGCSKYVILPVVEFAINAIQQHNVGRLLIKARIIWFAQTERWHALSVDVVACGKYQGNTQGCTYSKMGGIARDASHKMFLRITSLGQYFGQGVEE